MFSEPQFEAQRQKFYKKPFTSNSETREQMYVKEKTKPDSMLNYTSENFNPINMSI